MSRIQGKDQTHKMNKIPLPCLDGKIYIQNNGNDVLALGYQS